jgi:phosphate transport system protein
MDTSQLRHTNIQFEAELSGLRSDISNMGSLVERQIGEAVASLVNRDTPRAHEAIARDTEVNRFDVAIDERCIRLLALYQPAASDLRFITTGLKITTDLERIGDNAVNICERVVELNQEPQVEPLGRISQMAEIAQSMVRDSLAAFMSRDANLAESVIARDTEVDTLTYQISGELLAVMAKRPETIKRGTNVVFVLKNLERIADHATNIAEMVVFMVRGKMIRHMDTKKRHPLPGLRSSSASGSQGGEHQLVRS